jgi:hypothetical protein
VEPETVVPDNVPTVTTAPRTKFDPLIVMDALLLTPYVCGLGETNEIVGWGPVMVNAAGKVAASPPAAAGFSTWTSYTPGANEVFAQ